MINDGLETIALQFRKDLGLAPDTYFDPFQLVIQGIVIQTSRKLRERFPDSPVADLDKDHSFEWTVLSMPFDQESKQWIVVVNSHAPEKEQRLALVAELVQILLGYKLEKVLKHAEEVFTLEFATETNFDARYVAGAILYPQESAKNFVQNVLHVFGRGENKKIKRKPYEEMAHEADFFQIPPALVEERLKHLGLWSLYLPKDFEFVIPPEATESLPNASDRFSKFYPELDQKPKE